jgi:hypothetical protein
MAERSVQDEREQAADVFKAARALFQTLGEQGVPVSTRTRSMAPFLLGGERLVWRPPQPAPQVGDVVIFCQPAFRQAQGEGPEAAIEDGGEIAAELHRLLSGSLVVHRVVGRGRDGRLITKGDNLPHLDREPVPGEAVLGVVRSVREAPPIRRTRGLDGGGPRVYGRAMAWASRAGAALYRPAAAADALLRRVVPPLGDRRVFRLAVRLLQRSSQGLIHLLLYRICHRWTPEPRPQPRTNP